MNNRPSVDFSHLLNSEGIPTTETALAIELEKQVVAAGSKVSNDSRMSPFWRLLKAVVITPALWLMQGLLAGHVLPNTFAATAKGAYLDLKAWDVGLKRKAASSTRGVVEFYKQNPASPVVVPRGSVVETDRIEDRVYRLTVVDDVLIEAGKASGPVLCEAEHAGSAWNLAAGYFSILPIGIAGIVRAENLADWVTTPGADSETDNELALRIRNQFSVVGRYHIDAIYRSMMAEVAGVRSDQVYFQHDAPRGPGSANAYLLMDVGETPSHLLAQLNKHLMRSGNHGHGDDLLVLALPETRHSVAITLWAQPNTSEARRAELKTTVEKMIRAAFRETGDFARVTRTYPKSTFSFSQLTTEIHQQLQPDLMSLQFANSDIVSALAIPRLSSVKVSYGA